MIRYICRRSASAVWINTLLKARLSFFTSVLKLKLKDSLLRDFRLYFWSLDSVPIVSPSWKSKLCVLVSRVLKSRFYGFFRGEMQLLTARRLRLEAHHSPTVEIKHQEPDPPGAIK